MPTRVCRPAGLGTSLDGPAARWLRHVGDPEYAHFPPPAQADGWIRR